MASLRSPIASTSEADQRVLQDIICQDTITWCVRKFGTKLRAIVLTGSLARGEATFQKLENRWTSLGDAELFLVFYRRQALPPDFVVRALESEIATTLRLRKVDCRLSLSTAHEDYFRKLEPHIFAYELMAHGRVVWGDDKILSLIPPFTIADIPLEDGWRMLSNRMIELLEAAVSSPTSASTSAQRCNYKALKLYLDMATSYLLFAGAYAPTYRGRADRLKALSQTEPGHAPFPLPEFARVVMECTRIKLGAIGGLESAPTDADRMRESAVESATRLWHWELGFLTGQKGESSDVSRLMYRWMASQPGRERLRGWLYVLRKQGWHRSRRHWSSWMLYGWRASPRYQVYAAAGELFSKLPSLVQPNGQGEPALDWDGLRRRLPITNGAPTENGKWRQLASEIVWNYHEFLEGTRA